MTTPARALVSTDAAGWDQAVELARGLAEAGVSVVLALLGPRPDESRWVAATGIAGAQVIEAPFPLDATPACWGDVTAAGEWLLDLEHRHRCDVVHLGTYAHGALPFRSPKVVSGQSCLLSRWDALGQRPGPVACTRYRDEVASGLAAADQVVVPSGWMLSALERNYGPLPAAEVIPVGRDRPLWVAGEKEAVVLTVGAIDDDARNVRLLARAAPRLPWPVQIVDPRGLAAEALAARHGAAAVYAAPARYEPTGLDVLEAALSECALVLSDLPSFREMWQGAAIFVPPDDMESLETALLTLMNQPELTAVLALRARRRALGYTAARMIKRHLALYRRLIATRPLSHHVRRWRTPCHPPQPRRADFADLQLSAMKRFDPVETGAGSAEELPHEEERSVESAGAVRRGRGLRSS
jgi:glycogen(starch) synthase